MKDRSLLFLLAVFWVSAANPLIAATTAQSRSLLGLRTVRVVVEDLNKAAQQAGLHKAQLQMMAEKRLSDSGITVLRPQSPGKVPIVYVRLSSVVGEEEGRALLIPSCVLKSSSQVGEVGQGPDALGSSCAVSQALAERGFQRAQGRKRPGGRLLPSEVFPSVLGGIKCWTTGRWRE